MAFRTNVLVCAGTGCVSGNSYATATALENEIYKKGLAQEVQVIRTGCQGFCAEGPIVIVQPDGIFYCGVQAKDAASLVEEHLVKGRPVKKLMYTPPAEKGPIPALKEIPFFAKQKLVVLRNRGVIDPEKIDDYIAVDGYTALEKALFQMTPEQILSEIKRSGLRGRGGGGFPAGVKWETCRHAAQHRGVEPVIVCNADEGDPGAFMDRSIIESDPHSVLEGMIIGARAIGCKEGFVYIRHEYPIARERLLKAIDQARDYGLLGKDILGSGMDFDIEIVQGAGAFVCGESTALMASLEGNVGEPRAKYIHTVEYGYKNRPTNLNNVETWANVPLIINRGAQWFSSMGTGNVADNPWNGSSGTKVFSHGRQNQQHRPDRSPHGDFAARDHLRYRRRHPRRTEIQGGADRRTFRRLPARNASRYAGRFRQPDGSGIDDGFGRDDRHGRSDLHGGRRPLLHRVPDRRIVRQVHARAAKGLQDVSGCRSTESPREKASPATSNCSRKSAEVMQDCCLCALGTSAPNPVLSTLRYFKDEYDAHIKDHRCPGRRLQRTDRVHDRPGKMRRLPCLRHGAAR